MRLSRDLDSLDGRAAEGQRDSVHSLPVMVADVDEVRPSFTGLPQSSLDFGSLLS